MRPLTPPAGRRGRLGVSGRRHRRVDWRPDRARARPVLQRHDQPAADRCDVDHVHRRPDLQQRRRGQVGPARARGCARAAPPGARARAHRRRGGGHHRSAVVRGNGRDCRPPPPSPHPSPPTRRRRTTAGCRGGSWPSSSWRPSSSSAGSCWSSSGPGRGPRPGRFGLVTPTAAAVARHPHLGSPPPEAGCASTSTATRCGRATRPRRPDELERGGRRQRASMCSASPTTTAQRRARSWPSRLRCRVIVGEELRTHAGEIIGLFLTEHVPFGVSPREAAERIRAQGGRRVRAASVRPDAPQPGRPAARSIWSTPVSSTPSRC